MRSKLRLGIAATLAFGLSSGCEQSESEPSGPVDYPEQAILPECASDLAHSMLRAMVPVVDNGTVSLGALVSSSTSVEPTVQISGPNIFPRMAELIATANAEVNMQFYKWEVGTDATETLISGLSMLADQRRQAGASQPVKVRIVIDTSAYGLFAPFTDEYMPTVAAQIAAWDLDERYVSIELAAHERMLPNQVGNLHVKAAVVDGWHFFITGANPEAQHNYAEPWHDTGYTLSGDIARAAIQDFDYSWNRSQTWLCGSRPGPADECLEFTEPIEYESVAYKVLPNGTEACAVMALTRHSSLFLNNDIDNPQDQAFLAAFANAERKLNLETPNLNDDAAKRALIDAAMRGLHIRIILAKKFNDHSEQLIGGNNQQNVDELYRDLAAKGLVDPCQYLDIRWYSHDGIEPVEGNGPYANHTKYTSIDDQMVIFGEMNMDTASWNLSHEANYAVDDPTVTRAFDEQLFDADWQRAIPVTQCAPKSE